MDKKLKVNNILLAITIMLMAATNAFADKESDKFLKEVAQATKGSSNWKKPMVPRQRQAVSAKRHLQLLPPSTYM